jgi:solute carrier family 25 phosphate transporter 23/24/25/41
MAGGESQDERDQRVARLWTRLGAKERDHLDYNGLKKGLRKIDHRE